MPGLPRLIVQRGIDLGFDLPICECTKSNGRPTADVRNCRHVKQDRIPETRETEMSRYNEEGGRIASGQTI